METKAFNSEQHAADIAATRVGGLGGSDAHILSKIGEKGLAALSATDHKRLAVMMGLCRPSTWSGNDYTKAGHIFEDKMAEAMQTSYEREVLLERTLANNFKTFAHADFYDNNTKTVTECKYTQEDATATQNRYYSQLQFYYMLGAESVFLVVGRGDLTVTDYTKTDAIFVERDEAAIETIKNGIKILDEAITGGWKPTATDKANAATIPAVVAEAFKTLTTIAAEEAALNERKEAAKKTIQEFCEAFGLSGIFADGIEQQAVYVPATTSKTFDKNAFFKAFPSANSDEFYKTTTRAAYVALK